tara:strand:- start:325 stop:510 length:186 start_codon:yes stop_codon:yes gene_type:complete
MENVRSNTMNPKDINKNFENEMNEGNNSLDPKKEFIEEDEELREWREWALSYEDENGDVVD